MMKTKNLLTLLLMLLAVHASDEVKATTLEKLHLHGKGRWDDCVLEACHYLPPPFSIFSRSVLYCNSSSVDSMERSFT